MVVYDSVDGKDNLEEKSRDVADLGCITYEALTANSK